ncbi:MAG: aminoacyl-tRNA hydrolase [Planctomycetes bacterium]|nr:aminoacyl-tRNA hydrolase [Planctomycetota bacterium]
MERLIVGLGNPGDEYRGTRHNVGFEVIERVARLLNVRLERFRARGDSGKSLGHGCEDSTRGFALLEPSTYMNVSGVAVAAARDRYELNSPSILIICDDFHLPLGRIRVRPKGSAGGHNGLRSIIAMLGTDEFPRVRVGIGESPGPWQEFVLSRFARDERPVIERTISDSTDAIAAWCLSGDFDRLMNKLNAPPASQDPLQS